ncbi:polysaccharide pyruvyl transferase family protein [Candidatus Peregrinibacteria bacterium]|nr:polysaccharide pyruvyl transferase family protein [Candidatus Peregrinibacteria bacterium]
MTKEFAFCSVSFNMEQKRKTLLIFGNYGLPNWGDEGILAGIRRRIDQKAWKILVVSPFMKNIAIEHKLLAIPPPPSTIFSLGKWILTGKFFKTYTAVKNADLVIFGGGGLFQELPKKALSIWRRYFRFCVFFKKRILLIGNSFGPFRSQRSLRKTGNLLSSASFCSVRDENSLNILRDMHFPAGRSFLATDAAFLLPAKRSGPLKKSGILICLRNGDLSKEYLDEIRKFCRQVEKKKQKVEFLPMQITRSADDKLAAKLGIPLFLPKNLTEVRTKIAESEFLLGNRLHSGIFAMLSSTPFLIIPSRPKIQNFFTSCGLPKMLLSGKITAQKIMKKYEHLKKAGLPLKKEIKGAVKREKEKCSYLFPDFL